MNFDNMAFNRERLEMLSTAQLDELLQEELHKNPPDGDIVRLVLSVLKDREYEGETVKSPEAMAAWNRYLRHAKKSAKKSAQCTSWVLKVASVVVVVGVLVLAVPHTANATGIFDRVARWTDNFFQLLGFGEPGESCEEYAFRTDNPGLQQVYDTVIDLGVTDRIVPMWLPVEYELFACEIDEINEKTYLSALFKNEEKYAIYSMTINTENRPRQFFKDTSRMSAYEYNNTTYNIMYNNNMWVAVWIKENIECSITIDCQEETLYKILRSIYSMEAE